MRIIKQKPNLEGASAQQIRDISYFQGQIAHLVGAAADVGVVITVSNPPALPLAMGNYDLMVDARPLRNYVGRK